LYPAADRRYRTFSASGSICLREIGCSLRGRILGGAGVSEGSLVGLDLFEFASLISASCGLGRRKGVRDVRDSI